MGSTEEEKDSRAPGRAAAWIVASAIVLLVGAWISIPGIDTEVLEVAQGSLLGMFDTATPAFPIIGLSVGSLIVVRLALALIGKGESGIGRAVAFVIYLGLSAVQAFALAVWAESASFELPYGELVHEPGWSFRITAVVTCVAGAAVSWWLADRIDATRAATGALVFALFASMIALVHEASAFSAALSTGMVAPLLGLTLFVLPASMLALAVALAMRTPAGWPVTIARSLELRSSLDVLAAPSALAVLSGSALGSASLPGLVRALVVIAGTAGVIFVLRARVKERAPKRTLWPLAIAVASLAFALVPVTTGVAMSGVLATAFEPGPLEGEASFQITLAANDRFREGEADAMVQRLNALGAGAELVSAGERRITIRVEHARDTQSVLDALRPHTLELHLVNELPSAAMPDGVRPPSSYQRAPEGPCEIVRAWAPTLGCRAAIEPIEGELGGEPLECRVYCLDPNAIITSDDVAEARAGTDGYTGQPIVTATLTDDAAERFGRVTGENIQRQLAIVLDGEVVSAPVIQSAIPGGQLQITLGSAASVEEQLSQASSIAQALSASERITSEWTYESIE